MEKNDLDKISQLLDYLFERDNPQQRELTEKLIQADEKIRELYTALKNSLVPLSELQDDAPPLGLAEKTMTFVTQKEQERSLAASLSHPTILLDNKAGSSSARVSDGSRARWVLSNLRDWVAVAACLLLVFMVLRPGWKQVQQRAQQIACTNQLRNIGLAATNYTLDHQGFYPYLPRSAGTTWWSIGQQGNQNVSNTRDAYLLVRLGYLAPQEFLCPSVDNKQVHLRLELDPQKIRELQDFLGREFVNYSFRLVISRVPLTAEQIDTELPIASDQNPIFVGFDTNNLSELDLTDKAALLKENSPNHGKQGQNLLFPDNSVRFSTDRFFGPGGDDGFTIEKILLYRGREFPRSDKDIFIH